MLVIRLTSQRVATALSSGGAWGSILHDGYKPPTYIVASSPSAGVVYSANVRDGAHKLLLATRELLLGEISYRRAR